jgi:hypothetical protein
MYRLPAIVPEHLTMTFQTLQKSNPKKTIMCGKKLSGAEKLSLGQSSE